MVKIKEAKNGQLYFLVIARNHRVLATSETYKSAQGLFKGIEAAIGAAAEDKYFQFLRSSRNEPYFNLVARNYKVLLTSEMYTDLRKSRHGATVCRQVLLSGHIVDSTGRFDYLKQVEA